MAVNLNLLPQDLQLSKGLTSTLRTVRALTVILTVVFIFFCLGIGGFFVYSRISLNGINSSTDVLKSQVEALERSEQQLILLKDRLAKIASVRANPNASKNIEEVNSLLTNTSTALNMSEANITSAKSSLALDIYSNEDLSIFLNNVKKSTFLKSANLTSFSYNVNGYSLNLDINGTQ